MTPEATSEAMIEAAYQHLKACGYLVARHHLAEAIFLALGVAEIERLDRVGKKVTHD